VAATFRSLAAFRVAYGAGHPLRQAQDEARNPRLTSERKIAVRWVFIIETCNNPASIRMVNERVILGALRRLGQASKADLALYSQFTDNTVGVIVRDLFVTPLACP
jgi:hypothetical protein